MIRQAIAAREPPIVRGFRHRGHHDVSRIESFSDAVFGFTLTLLVVSLQVPRTFDELLAAMSGFPAFAISFSLLAQIWYLQYRFFRRYGLEDVTTMILNMALLFTIVFFTYPLKFLFGLIGAANSPGAAPIRDSQEWQLFAVYGAGYAAVFVIFALLHRHALALRDELALTPLEIFETTHTLRFSLVHVLVAAASVAICAGFSLAHAYETAAFAGGCIYPIGLLAGGSIMGRAAKRRRAELSNTP